MVTAAIKFTQGATTDLAGRALLGLVNAAVTVESFDTSPLIAAYLWTLVEAPEGSALPVSPVDPETLLPAPGGPGDFGTTASDSFTPDVSGCYVVDLELTDVVGQKTRDRRVFGVLEASGRLIPPFLGDNRNMNFGGQTDGYAPYVNGYLRAVDLHDTDIDDLAEADALLQTADAALDARIDAVEARPAGHVVQNAGTPLTQRAALNLIGFTVADNPGSGATDVTASPGVATVANFAALSGLAANVLHAYVTSRKGHYLKFNGVWGRLDVADPASLTQATWFIGGGSDDNDGLTSGTALATWAEFMARLGGTGRRIVLPQNTTVTVLTNLNEVLRGDIIVEDGGLAGAANRLFVLGTVQSTLLPSTAITSIVQEDTTTGVERQITVTGLDFTPYVGKRARRTSDNAVFWITAAVSLGVAAISTPGILDPLNWNITPGAATLAAGNTFVIEDLPDVLGFNMNIGRGSTSQTAANFMHAIFDSLDFSGGGEYSKMMEGLGANTSSRNVFSRCKINTMRSMAWNGHGQLCYFEARNTSNNTLSTVNFVGPNKALLFTNCHFSTAVLFNGDISPTLVSGNTLRGTGIATNGISVSNGAMVTSGTFGIYNAGASAVLINSFGRLAATGVIHGSGNAQNGINVASSGLMTYTSAAKPTVKGSTPGTNDVNIGGTNYDYATNVPKFDTAKACGIVVV